MTTRRADRERATRIFDWKAVLIATVFSAMFADAGTIPIMASMKPIPATKI